MIKYSQTARKFVGLDLSQPFELITKNNGKEGALSQ